MFRRRERSWGLALARHNSFSREKEKVGNDLTHLTTYTYLFHCLGYFLAIHPCAATANATLVKMMFDGLSSARIPLQDLEARERTHYCGTCVAPLHTIGQTTLLNFQPGHRLCAIQHPTGTNAPRMKPVYSHIYLPTKNLAGATAPQMMDAE